MDGFSSVDNIKETTYLDKKDSVKQKSMVVNFAHLQNVE